MSDSDTNKAPAAKATLSRREALTWLTGGAIMGATGTAGINSALSSKNREWDLEGKLLLGGIPGLLKEALYYYVQAEEITQIKDIDRHRENLERAYQVIDFIRDKIKNAPGHASIQDDIKILISDFERAYRYPSPDTVKAFFRDEEMTEEKLENKTNALKKAANGELTDLKHALDRNVTLSKKYKGEGR